MNKATPLSRRKKEWEPHELVKAINEGRITQKQLDAADINGVMVDPHTGKVTLEQKPNDLGGQQKINVGQEDMPERVMKRTPQQRVDSLMEKVSRGIQQTGLAWLPDNIIEEIRLEYKWQEGKNISAEMVRAILAKYLHIETNKAEERYNKTVTYSRPSYTGPTPK